MDQLKHVWFHTPRDEHGYPPNEWEAVDAEPHGDEFTLTRSPVYTHGLASGDSVSVETDSQGRLVATSVTGSAGTWCSRVVPFRPNEASDVLPHLSDLECETWVSVDGLVVVEVLGSTDPGPILERLDEGRSAKVWDFDLAVRPTLWE